MLLLILIFYASCKTSNEDSYAYEFSSEVDSIILHEIVGNRLYYDSVFTWLHLDTNVKNGNLLLSVYNIGNYAHYQKIKQQYKYTYVDSFKIPIMTYQEAKSIYTARGKLNQIKWNFGGSLHITINQEGKVLWIHGSE